MATITMKNGDIRQIGFELNTNWQAIKGELKVSGKAMYAIISLKKRITELTDMVTESFLTVGQNLGGVVQQDGSLKIPDENIEEANKQLTEIALETQEIEYKPIILHEEDSVPTDIMELLFDFIEMED